MINRVKVMFFVFTLCICASLCASTDAQAKIKRGKWKDNISWSYDTNKKELVLTGSGAIARSYESEDDSNFPEWELFPGEIKTVRIEGKITRICAFFSGAGFRNMTSLELGKSVKTIGNSAFHESYKLKSVKLPNGLKSIQAEAFWLSGLRKVTIPGTVEKMGDGVFQSCRKLKEVIYASGNRKTGKYTFWNCEKLKKVKLPTSLKIIEKGCFRVTGLVRITIPENVEEIGDSSFAQASTKKAKLKDVTIKSKKVTKWGKDIFKNAHRDLVIHVPARKKLQYELALRANGLPTYVKVVGEASLD